ncbi:MAG: hypothetical protein QME50_02120 [Candidatus Bathyarchaeota archaeon]|nr:hypothetical protein [Candidatus Bathyarchaeota archaeon]MDI6805454.1 hypothetical protein [Candidatus Bathyarchaeia archaeon]
MKCVICNREAEKEGYCILHSKAYESISKKYELWRKALEISWKEYLSEIVKNPLTGEWAREVAEYLIKSGEKHDVKKS